MRRVDETIGRAKSSAADHALLIVPGLRDHVADHWQTLLANRLDICRIVPPLGPGNIDLDARLAAIEAEAAKFAEPFIVVAHSAGAVMTAH